LLSILVPTYNEKENIKPLYEAIKKAIDDFELIFIDDNSPDGTAEVIKEIQAEDDRIKLLERKGKLGLGSAIVDGLNIAQGEYIAMMDADLSHPPSQLPTMLKALHDVDIVIGSRYIEGGRIEGWSLLRHLISRIAIFWCHLFLGVRVKDPISGFALWRRGVVEKVKDELSPKGFKILLEILIKCHGAKIKEVPITFTPRLYGRSKLGFQEIKNFLSSCWELKTRHPYA
jgi:dolichol-phosphate mannosyltransferase